MNRRSCLVRTRLVQDQRGAVEVAIAFDVPPVLLTALIGFALALWRGARPQNTAPSTVTPLPRNVGAVSAAPTAAGDDRAAHHFLREFAWPILLLPDLPAALICLLRRGRSRSTRRDYRWPPVKAPSRRLGRPMMRAAQSNQPAFPYPVTHTKYGQEKAPRVESMGPNTPPLLFSVGHFYHTTPVQC